MKKNVKISIIIPVYNAEKTIIRCLSSIVDTNYNEYEIIVINDGSIDNSVFMIKEFMKKNCYIRLFSQENSGLSAARNKGIEIAEGDIICFVDSDDYVASGYIEKIAEIFNKTETDIIYFEYSKVDKDGNIILKYCLPDYKTEYFDNLMALSDNDIFGFAWIKAIRKEIIGHKRFVEGISLFEDELFTCSILKEPYRLYYLRETLYFYVRTEGTLFYRTYQNYCHLNDMCWNAWSEVLSNQSGAEEFLTNKANHMANICKWYGLERKIKPKSYFLEMAKCNFIKNVTINDTFIEAIKIKKWGTVAKKYITYKVKNRLYRIFK